MISIEQALACYSEWLRPLPPETLPLAESLWRVLAEPVTAKSDLPRFDQSAVDGYAVRAADTPSLRMPVSGESAAGRCERLPELAPRAAFRIFTGAAVPLGADTVIQQERVTRTGESIELTAPFAAGRNIRYRGEELKRGAIVAAVGARITPGLLAALAHAGAESVRVFARPRVRVIVTGDEVRPPGAPLAPGEIPDSNGPLIRAVLQSWGYPPPVLQHVGDDEHTLRQALAAALDDADVVVTTGGASVGDRDFVPSVAAALGVEQVFWKVAQKPGKPLYFGVRSPLPLAGEGEPERGQASLGPGERAGHGGPAPDFEREAGRGAVKAGERASAALLGLPGNPAAVLVGLLLHLRRVLDVREGAAVPGPHFHWGRIDGDLKPESDRDRLLRMAVKESGDGIVRLQPLPGQGSHMLSNLGAADALVLVPASGEPVAAGACLRWIPLPG